MAVGDLALGRKPAPDSRDQNFLARAVLPSMAEEPLIGYKNWWDLAGWNLQGNEGTCVGWNGTNYLFDSPVTHPHEVLDGREFYRDALLVDEWPGNDWTSESQVDYQFGTSVRAFAKVAQARSYFGTYLWAFDLDTALRWLRYHGPVLVGTTWYESMFETVSRRDARGTTRQFLNIDDSQGVAGGHCWIWNGVNIEGRYIRGKLGSWPRSMFGDNGRCAISFEDAERLIAEDGEVMMALEVAH